MSNCVVCGTEFSGKRSTAKYCSGKCRKAGQRVRGTEIELCPSKNVPLTESIEQAKRTAVDPETQAIWDRWDRQRRPNTYPHKFNDKINLALPGEPDYNGVCQLIEGVWKICA